MDRELTADRDTWDRFTSKQQFTRYGFVGFSFAIFVASWFYLNMSLEYIWTGPAALGDLFSRMFPPNPVIIPEMVGPLLTSIHIAILGTVFSIVLSVPVAFIAADKTSPNRYTYGLGKVIITVSRSVHEIIWTLLFVVMFGPGALAGVLALSVRSVGFIGKLLNEAIEEIDMTQVEAMKATGAGTAKTFVYAIVPQVMPAFIGIATYRWDSNVRASTVVGFVGGGGIGVLLMDTINTFRWAEAVVILGAILSVVLFSEVVSAYLRKKVM
ncbi:phosphonate ABC transporter, permease protein PhnE [Natronorarus salvus]|uniref:phosphonate ABC transporter, permease protein PhnE n=1 Tax=Natronorarus salvus TaxID=3117733 RepID=UPI003908125E